MAPTEQVPVLLGERDQDIATRMARDRSRDLARETAPPAAECKNRSVRRGSFKSMPANRHCIIPAEGFYEWREENGKKQPHIFERKDGKPLNLAGICHWSEVKCDRVPSFAIPTDEPNELIAPYPDRMAVAVKDSEKWRDPHTSLGEAAPLDTDCKVRAVNPAVNKASEKSSARSRTSRAW